jgi:predicted dehydrogenase
MIDVCQQAGVPLFVAYYRRCLPAFRKVKELVTSGAIGDVRLINTRLYQPPQVSDGSEVPWRLRPEIAGGGLFYDLGSHQLDFLDYLFGPITGVSGQAVNQAGMYQAEDAVMASWVHESGVVGSGSWCFTVAPEHTLDQAEIYGSQGRITFSTFDSQPVCLETSAGRETFTFPRQDPIQQPLIETVVAELRGEGQCPSTGVSAARTNWVMEQIINLERSGP